MKKRVVGVLFVCFFSIYSRGADRFLQILHVSDLHSFWENNELDGGGGYARIKALMDSLEEDAKAKGWPTLRLDAGDFADGNLNFLPDRGVTSFKLEHAMGFDAVALGNHDYIMGLEDLIVHSLDPQQKVPLVAANFESIHDAGVSPGLVVDKNGLKIAIGGATIKSIAFDWAAWPARLIDPVEAVTKWLGQQKVDLRIALTHLGLTHDQELAKQSRDIDLIIGGHTHLTLYKPITIPNKDHKLIPIVQPGAHGSFLGQMIIKLSDGKAPEIQDYQLHKINPDMIEDSEIRRLIQSEEPARETYFQQDLKQVVATSENDYFTHQSKVPRIGNFLGDAMREAAHSEIALDSGYLYGDHLPQGPITVEKIYSLAPHTYRWSSKGWHIYTCEAYPMSIELALTWLSTTRYSSLVISGMDFAINKYHVPRNIKVNGKPMNYLRTYKAAFSEGFFEVLSGKPQLASLLCSKKSDTGILVREALLEKARAMKVISDQTLGPPRAEFWGQK